MNWYISDTDKKHLRRQVDTNNHCSFSLGKVLRASRLHVRNLQGRVSPSPCSTQRVALSTAVQNASQPFHSSVLYQESRLHGPDSTQHPPSCKAGEAPAAPSTQDKLFRDHPTFCSSSGESQVQGSYWTWLCQGYERKARF